MEFFKLRSGVAAIALAWLFSAEVYSAQHFQDLPTTGDFKEVQALFEAREYDAAKKLLSDISAEGQQAVGKYLWLSKVHLELGAGIAAETAIERARELGADYAITAVPYAKALLVQGKYSAALAAMRGVSVPTYLQAQAYIVSGDASFALNDTKTALRDYNLAIEADDSNFQPYLGKARLSLRNNNLEGAFDLAIEAEQRNKTNTMVQYTLGLISRYMNRMDDAEQYFLEAVRLFPGNILANIELASLRINQGRIADAEGYLDAVYAVSDKQPMALYLTAVILAGKGEFAEAELLLQRVRSLTDSYLPAMYVRGLVAYQVEKFDIAAAALEKVLEIRPTNKPARMALAGSYTKLQRPRAALRVLKPLLDVPDQKDTAVLSMAAAAAMAAGDAERGKALYAKVASLQGQSDAPVASRVVSKLALAQFVTGNREDAVSTISSVSAGAGAEVRELALMASMQLRNNDQEGAKQTIDKIIETAPDRALGYNMKATLAYTAGDYKTAIEDYSRALQRKADYTDALRNRGLSYFRLGSYRQAEKDLRDLLQRVPDDHRAKAILGKTLLTMGRAEDAVSYFKEAVRAIPGSIALAEDYAQALAEAGSTTLAIEQARSTARRGSDKPETLKRMGLLLLELGQPAAAERPLSRYVAFNPSSGQAHVLHGRALIRMGLFTGAKISFERARSSTIDRPSEDILTWYLFAAEALAKRQDEALALLQRLDKGKRPSDISASVVGDILLHAGMLAEAEAEYNAVLSSDENGTVAIGLATALSQQGRDADAISMLQQYVREHSGARLARAELGNRLEKAGSYEAAAEQYREILRSGVADATTAAKLASVYLKMNNRQSIRLVEQAILISPDDPFILDAHGWVLLQADRDTDAAVKSLEKAVRRAPASALYKYHLGMAYLAQNRRREAYRSLTQALNLNPDFEGADEARRQVALLEQ